MTFAVHDRIPSGDVAIRPSTRVVDAGGHRVGHVRGVALGTHHPALAGLTVTRQHVFDHDDVRVAAADIDALGGERIRLRG